MSDKKNLQRLVRRAMKGDSAAFEKLIASLSTHIIFNIGTQLDSKNDVQDVAQEVVLALHNNIAKLRSPNAFYAYLQRVIKNVCITRNLKHRTLHRAADIDEYADTFEADRSEQPPAQLEQKELTEQVKGAIAKLPTKQRETLYLYYYDELSYKEIARIQGVSTNTVGVNISKAKATLKKMVEMRDASDMTTRRGTDTGTDVEKDAAPGAAPDPAHKRGVAGVLTTPVLTDAVSLSVGELAPRTVFDSLPLYAHRLMVEGGGLVAGGTAVGIFASTSYHFVVAATAVTVAVGGLGAVGNQIVNTAMPADEPALQYTEFIPEAAIEFTGGGNPPNINPVSARATTDAGSLGTWNVVDKAGVSVLEGHGDVTGDVLASLPRGAYTIRWQIINGTTEQSIPAVMRRDFTVG